jgi:hypothetical protein
MIEVYINCENMRTDHIKDKKVFRFPESDIPNHKLRRKYIECLCKYNKDFILLTNDIVIFMTIRVLVKKGIILPEDISIFDVESDQKGRLDQDGRMQNYIGPDEVYDILLQELCS